MIADVDTVLDLIGFRWMQFLMLIAHSCHTIYVVSEIMGVPSIVVACEFKLNDTELFLLTSAGFVGMIVSGHYAGYKSDIIGRRASLLFAMSLGLISSFLSLLMPWFYAFLFFRFATGLFVGAVMTNSFTYLVEFTKISLRPIIANFASYPICMAGIVVPFINHLNEPLDSVLWSWDTFHVRRWRLCLFFNYVPGLIGLIIIYLLPESVKFLLSIGDGERAYEALDRLCKRNHGKSLSELDVTGVTQPHIRVSIISHRKFFVRMWYDTKPLFGESYRKPVILIILIMCGVFFVGNGLNLWFLKINNQLTAEERIMCDHLEDTTHLTEGNVCSDRPVSYLENMMLGAASICCCVFISIMLRLIRRRSVMCINTIIAALAGFSLNFIKHNKVLLAALLIFIAMCTTCISLVASVTADVVPTHLRGKAIALVFMFARFAVIIANCIFGHFAHTWCLITFNLFVLVTVAVVIMILFLPV
ncbi:putative transporter svop-1 isoform X2 [Drosophila nasuta]|uniref:putative transporter svop-1 isoform X2 n=1 Tax=Drosophila nasuta TaxID=42062 RepID=UPI00295E5155|nr:putative transporter svop-1 isoform X2 [Drosophila nasuta]